MQYCLYLGSLKRSHGCICFTSIPSCCIAPSASTVQQQVTGRDNSCPDRAMQLLPQDPWRGGRQGKIADSPRRCSELPGYGDRVHGLHGISAGHQVSVAHDDGNMLVQRDGGSLQQADGGYTGGGHPETRASQDQAAHGGREELDQMMWNAEAEQLLPTQGLKLTIQQAHSAFQELHSLAQRPALVLRFHALRAIAKIVAKDGNTLVHWKLVIGHQLRKLAGCTA